ncbi:hypothetical protein D3C73_915420 [compost metagenome]
MQSAAFVPEQSQVIGVRADERDSRHIASQGEIRPFTQEAIPRMDGIAMLGRGGGNDGVDIDISRRAGADQRNRGIRKNSMPGV